MPELSHLARLKERRRWGRPPSCTCTGSEAAAGGSRDFPILSWLAMSHWATGNGVWLSKARAEALFNSRAIGQMLMFVRAITGRSAWPTPIDRRREHSVVTSEDCC